MSYEQLNAARRVQRKSTRLVKGAAAPSELHASPLRQTPSSPSRASNRLAKVVLSSFPAARLPPEVRSLAALRGASENPLASGVALG